MKSSEATGLGAALAATRKEAGLSQAELARRIRTDRARISKLENGQANPTYSTLMRYAKAVGVKLSIELTK